MRATGPVNGWTAIDVFGMLGVTLVAFGVANAFFYGIVDLPTFVVKGTFDNTLLSPVSAFIKLAGSSFSVTAFGDLLQGLIVVVIYGIYLHFSLYVWLLYITGIILGCIVFTSIRLLCSLIVFFIHDGEVVSGQVWEIFMRPGLYPGSIFPDKLKLFFMTIIPTLITSAVPIDIVKGASLRLLLMACVVTLVWLVITYYFFVKAIKRYESGNFLR